MRRNVIETIMGAVVLLVAALFLFFAYSSANLHSVAGYQIVADFSRLGGLQSGGDVRVSGVKVGSVTSMELDPKTYLAHVSMSIDPSIQLPTDTVAAIKSESLLGGKYMALDPGGADDKIPPGGRVHFTVDPVDFESLIGKYMFSGGSQGSAGGDKKPDDAQPPQADKGDTAHP
jgi:phospholipid/cholesterol/gamma-HCH transport system substrate-binding protein